ncbi:helix-turn-helix domain-containing protein [Pedobacter hiemivivus]|uniref:Helix-turn-helix domain-containing protein n=1 Tax=Pedobacter hiemivivus TaxID=2530454 RepID=A0A4U1G497_9SPHI|nr:helix-turn-helix domain-containing protein [Pedobacter hiemivivus]TKC58114.1 helix-turn-helix domain-containing protein [Pedobacter hiemivivus]
MMKNIELAKKIKELRTKKGFSQDELSIATQLNLRTIQRIESGETEPRGDTLKRLAAALQVTPDELIDWTEEEDTTVLMFLNISALSFIVFPLLGVIIPFVLWVSKKDKIKKLNVTGKKLLNFQITWCIIFFTMNVLYFMAFMFKKKISSSFIPGLGGTESFILLIPILYGLNIIIIVFNAIRSYKNKTVIYQPAIPFLR